MLVVPGANVVVSGITVDEVILTFVVVVVDPSEPGILTIMVVVVVVGTKISLICAIPVDA